MTTMTAKRRAVQRQREDLNQATPRPVPVPARGVLQGEATGEDKIIPQTYRTILVTGARRVFIDAVDGGYGMVSEDDHGRRSPFYVFGRYVPAPTFEQAQEDLDRLAQLKGWESENPLPRDPDEDLPQPAPVRRRARGNGAAGQAAAADARTGLARSAYDAIRALCDGKGLKRVPVPDTSLLDGGASPGLPESRLVPLAAVVASPYQTRREFPEEQLRALGESLRARQLVPIRVRMVDAPKPAVGFVYELVAGERRVRAARLVGLETLRAEVVELTDAEARWEVGADNEERRSFNPIERALWFQSLIAAGMTQDDLAKRLGWAGQASVSNAVAVLKLPKKPWQEWISTEMLPAGHARAVLPYAEYPALLAAIAQSFVHQRTRRADKIEFGSYDEFVDEVRFTVRTNTRPLDGKEWDDKTGQQVPIFTPTAEQRARLGIIQVARESGKGAVMQERATNVSLWKTWQGAWAKAGKAEARAGKAKPENLSKREVERRAKEQAGKYQKRLAAFQADWLRWLLSERLRDGRDVDVGMVLALCLYFAASRRPLPPWASGKEREIARRSDELERVIYGTGHSVKSAEAAARALVMLSGLPDCAAHVAQWAAAMFWVRHPERGSGHPGEVVPHVPAEDLKVFAHRLGIVLEAAWQKEHCGPLTRRYWELHTREELLRMVREELGGVKIFIGIPPKEPGVRWPTDTATWTKGDLVDALLLLRPADSVRVDKKERVLPMPAELRPTRRGPGRRKKD